MSLSNLIQDMETFAKARLPDDPNGEQDDAAIAEAAENANADNAEQGFDSDIDLDAEFDAAFGSEGEDDEDEDEDESGALTKSFRFVTADGEEAEAFDATELIKSMQEGMDTLRSETEQAVSAAVTLIKSQHNEIISLRQQIAALGATGRGRKASITVLEKQSPGAQMTKSAVPDGLSRDEFFAKAEQAQRSGRITASDVSIAEAYLNKGQPVPERIVRRVVES